MTEAMKFDLVSPERKLASMEVNMVQIPAAEGDITAMVNHSPTIVNLRPGIIRAVATNGDIMEYVVSSGFAEISAEGTTILAERSLPKEKVDSDFFDSELKLAESQLEAAGDNAVASASAQLMISDLNQLKSIVS